MFVFEMGTTIQSGVASNKSLGTTAVLDFEDEFSTAWHVVRNAETIIGQVGNILVIVVIFKEKRLHAPGNLILVSLAASDIVSNFHAPLMLILDQLKLGGGKLDIWIKLCYFATYIHLFSGNANVFSVCLSAIDRCISIRYAIKYRIKT